MTARKLNIPRRTVVSIAAFIVAAVFGRGPITPAAIWLPNRVFALVTIAASGPLALLLQQRRLAAESARELNGLLHSLMAHDLRPPLALARDALTAVEKTAGDGGSIDPDLLRDVDAWLRRSLRAIELMLHAARADIERGSNAATIETTDPVAELRDEIGWFEREARHRGKALVVDAPPMALPLGAALEAEPAWASGCVSCSFVEPAGPSFSPRTDRPEPSSSFTCRHGCKRNRFRP